MSWAVRVTRVGKKRTVFMIWWGNAKEIDSLEDLDVIGMIILKRSLK
jgi:hypothetical protein